MIVMNAQIRRLEKLLEATDHPAERERITRLIEKATRDAQKANAAARKVARETARIEERKRAMDTQRKIVAGAICLSHMEQDETFRGVMSALIREFAEKRYWFHFPEVFGAKEIETALEEVKAARSQNAAEKAHQHVEETSGVTAANDNRVSAASDNLPDVPESDAMPAERDQDDPQFINLHWRS
jgi:hypothetical protein